MQEEIVVGREPSPGLRIEAPALDQLLRHAVAPDAVVTDVVPIGQEEARTELKAYGYGRPLRISFESGGRAHQVVLRTMAPDPFGHERRSDRVAVLVGAFDTFGAIARHVRPIATGAFTRDGELVSLPPGEPFLLTEFVEGDLYARDLELMTGRDVTTTLDVTRARALATYLAQLHSEPADPADYARCLRDTVGSGEGIFGLCDSYPAGHPVATRARLMAIEHAAVEWRWRLRERGHRARQTHGDFHPFNVLFRAGADFTLLDRSRGGVGEPADDVTCMAINYLFFALTRRGSFDGAARTAWDTFWGAYLEATRDRELLDVVAPFFAWRGLVVASPVWYPKVRDEIRGRLLRFVERLLAGETFDPQRIDELVA